MTRPKVRSFLTGISIVLVCVALAVVAGQAHADTVTPRTMERELAPVIVTGDQLPALQGAPDDSLFVYRHWEGNWQQIPFQVDRVVGGVYTATEGPLGPGDEIAFMAADLGDLPAIEDIAQALPDGATWYRIEVTDPLTPTHRGWAYVVHSPDLSQTFTETYASFDAVNNRIVADRYALGFAEEYIGFDYFALNDSGVDILDRTRIRVKPSFGPIITEEQIDALPIGLIKDGPVRVIAQEGTIIGYDGLIEMSLAYDLSADPFGVESIRLSMNFNVNAVTSTFYNANTPDGVPIDGESDPIAVSPLSTWWQVSGETGTLVQVADPSGVGGIQANYYKDDKEYESSYGDTGIHVQNPDTMIVYHAAYGVLPPNRPNVGADYADRLAQPLQVEATMGGEGMRLYLPLVVNRAIP